MPPERPPLGADDEDLFDEYLDAALRGEATDPEAFCRERGEVPGALKSWIEGVHRLLSSDAPSPPGRTVAPALPAEEGLPYEHLGEFRLLRRLGEGAMGVVYLAEQGALNRLVAVKVIRPELAGSATATARFDREARALARLAHPHLAAIHGFGEHEGVRFFAMELVPGESLAERIDEARRRGERIPVPEAVRIGRQIAEALDHAHRAGVLHRDVKPSNIRLGPGGRAVLIDFGLARALGDVEATLTRSFAGSPAYASPEQVAGRRDAIDARTDVYSLGATLYEAITGDPPFGGDSVESVLHRIVSDEPRAPRSARPDVPRDVDVVIRMALEKDPARRYASARAFADDLAAILDLRPVRARAPGLVLRLGKWCRRNRASAAAIGAAWAVLAGGAAWLAVDARAQRIESERRAAEIVADVRARLETVDADRGRSEAAEWDAQGLRAARQNRWLRPEETARLREKERLVEDSRRDEEGVLAFANEQLLAARDLDPQAPGWSDARALLYFLQWRHRSDARSDAASEHYRGLLRATDPSGAWTRRMEGRATVHVSTEPPGARLFLFRCVEESSLLEEGDRRLVPVPYVDDALGTRPARFALRVVSGAGEIPAGDWILALEGAAVGGDSDPGLRTAREAAERGGIAARLWHDGVAREATLPAGLRVRATAAPLFVDPAFVLGTTPREPLLLPPGSWVLVARLDGHEEQRLPFHVDHSAEPWARELRLRVTLQPEGTTPEGFVRVACEGAGQAGERPFWMMEREVTLAEYLEFVNDRDVEAPEESAGGRAIVRDAEGRRALADAAEADLPVRGVSWAEARRYARWRTRRSGLDARGFVLDLPTRLERDRAAHGGDGRRFPWGDRFDPSWTHSRFARPQVELEPVLGFPIDESSFGVFDLAGSVSEWCVGAASGKASGEIWLAGGRFDTGIEIDFLTSSVQRVLADGPSEGVGFRLVARRSTEDNDREAGR